MSALEGFAARLREARMEMHLDQISFGKLGGAGKNSQIDYEAGRTAPKVDYLFGLADHGVDIGYILTGRRTDGSTSGEQLLLLDGFGRLSSREREVVMTMVMMLAGMTTSTAEIGEQAQLAKDTLHDRQLGYKAPGMEE